jgi:hypothetical protein
MFGLPRILTVYAIAIPLALVLGYAISTPDQVSLVMVGLLVLVLALPVFIQWHHILLIFFWNSAFNFPFLPAQPHVWLLLAGLSFGISWLNGLLGPAKPLRVPELTRPLLFLAGVVVLTAYARGGLGSRIFGSASYGGRNYFYIFGAIMGYFALAAVRIPMAKASRTALLYCVSGVTYLLAHIVFILGPAFYFLFYVFGAEYVGSQATVDSGIDPGAVVRFGGISAACAAVVGCLLLRWGIRGIFSFAHPWRMTVLVVAVLLSLLGGFRGDMIILGLIFLCQFFVEGLWRTRFLALLAGFGVLAGVMLFAFSDRLPLAAQRAVSFLPVKIDPGIRADAEQSVEWRLQMWRILWPQIPKYLLVGKGYAIDPNEMYFASLPGASGGIEAEVSLVSGDYHSGPLSTIIPLGLGGMIGLLWLLGAGIKVLYRNYRYGDPALHYVNVFFLAIFIAQTIFFLTVYGAFSGQLFGFTGLLGMSVSLNGGVRKSRPVVPARAAMPATMEAAIPVQA